MEELHKHMSKIFVAIQEVCFELDDAAKPDVSKLRCIEEDSKKMREEADLLFDSDDFQEERYTNVLELNALAQLLDTVIGFLWIRRSRSYLKKKEYCRVLDGLSGIWASVEKRIKEMVEEDSDSEQTE
jgi:hypothetical protein